uniref:Testis expressed 264, ER-phagy receptor n=1 Tax=Oryctolagus cuniculus TaxID=9986 RepID=A0A5F9CLX4_RABIT
MSDLLLLGLIGGLTLLLLLTLLAFAGYSGLLAGVAVSAGSPPIHNITVAYKFHVGPYDETGQLFTESCSISPKLRSIAVYYDNPHTVPSEKCRCAVGSILSEGEESPSPELIQLYQRFGFKLFSFPAPSHVVTATFPYTTALSIWLAARRVHPALDTYIKERKLCAHPRLEIYQQDRIHFMCPLARQGDFYVPEVKETERRSRGLVETSDTPMDGTGREGKGVRVGLCLEAPPYLGWHRGEADMPTPGPTHKAARSDVWLHIDVDSHSLPPATQIHRSCTDAFPRHQGYPWKRPTDSRVPRLLRKGVGEYDGYRSGRWRGEQGVGPHPEPVLSAYGRASREHAGGAARAVSCPFPQSQPTPLLAAIMPQVQAHKLLAYSQPTPCHDLL